MSTTSAHHAACAQSRSGMVQYAVPASPSTPSPSSSVIASSPSSKPFKLLLCKTVFTLTAALRPWSYTFVCDTRATHCPCQLKTGPVSSRHTHMSMVVDVQLDNCAVAIFRMCGFFSSSTTTLPACTTLLIEIKGFTTCALLNFMHRCTPSADLNGMVFSPTSLTLSPFATTNLFVARAIQFYIAGTSLLA